MNMLNSYSFIKSFRLLCFIAISFSFNTSCSIKQLFEEKGKKNCTRMQFYHSIKLRFDNQIDFEDTPTDSIRIYIIDPHSGSSSIQSPANLQFHTDTANMIHTIHFENMVDFQTMITVSVRGLNFKYTDFRIKETKSELMFFSYYRTCIIKSCRLNGRNIHNPYQIQYIEEP